MKGPIPIWDEKFSFHINTGHENIVINIINSQSQVLGKIQIPISVYED